MQIRLSARSFLIGATLLSLVVFIFGKGSEETLAVGGPLRETYEQGSTSPYKKELSLLNKKEDILRSHFANLAEEDTDLQREKAAVRRALLKAHTKGDTKSVAQLEKRLASFTERTAGIKEARRMLLALQRDKKRYEALLLESYRDVAMLPKKHTKNVIAKTPPKNFVLEWPVHPSKGISSTFMDSGYKKRFGIEHYAVDIPTPQGSPLYAAAEGEVLEVHDRGYGYSTISLKHADDLVTVYGHVSSILVKEGDHVFAGERIGLTGGRPGSKGAGLLTTGPHLHLEVLAFGQPIDPLYYLPPVEEIVASAS